MNHVDLKRARRRLGLSLAGMAAVLGVTADHVRRMEAGPASPKARALTSAQVRLIRAYLDGYRPDDWPIR